MMDRERERKYIRSGSEIVDCHFATNLAAVDGARWSMLDVFGEGYPLRHPVVSPVDVLVVQFVEEALRSDVEAIAVSIESEWKYKGTIY